MKWLLLSLIVGVAGAMAPLAAHADEGGRGGVVIRIDGDAVVAKGESLRSLVVLRGDAVVAGEVRESVLVIDGNLRVSGSVRGGVTVVSGRLDLEPQASVRNVYLFRSDLNRAPGAAVGDVRRSERFFIRGTAALLSIAVWAGMTVAVVAAGLLFAAVGGRQMVTAATALTAKAGGTAAGAALVWIGMPVVAVLLILTVIGIPLALGLLVFLLPALWFLGYLVVGVRLGGALVGLTGKPSEDPHPYGAATVGLVLLQLMVLVPVVGTLLMVLAGVVGAGAIAYCAYRAAAGRSLGAVTAAPAAGSARVAPTA